VLPDFIIIGGQRCGTTSFYSLLSGHRGVLAAAGKELHFFDLNWHRGVSWYRSHFPLSRQMAAAEVGLGFRPLTGEATPYYLFHPQVPARVASVTPRAKLLVLLRDPVDRAYSHYEWMRKHQFETLPFMEALEREGERIDTEAARIASDPSYNSFAHRNFSYLARGRYAEQLERWLALFPRDQILVLRSEDFFSKTEETVLEALDFLDLPLEFGQGRREWGQRYTEALSPHDRDFLIDYYREPNKSLYDMLGRDLRWSR
jgi:hypothetical protein